jgi:transforming growth factor-beta-induced protein
VDRVQGSIVALVIVSTLLGIGVAKADNAPADIVDTAVQAGNFKTLAAALSAADLVDTLKGAKLPDGVVADLLRPENVDRLKAILTYHVVPGAVRSEKVVMLSSAQTVNGQSVDIVVNGTAVMVESANVVATDIVASNGIIHVIDSVILPQ